MSVTPDGDATVTVVVRLLGSATRRDLAVLDAHERERARRFVFDVDRDRYVAAHAWTRRMLAARTDVRPGDITVVRDERGKPGVPGGPSFSLSHDDDLAALAVGPPGMAIGWTWRGSLARWTCRPPPWCSDPRSSPPPKSPIR